MSLRQIQALTDDYCDWEIVQGGDHPDECTADHDCDGCGERLDVYDPKVTLYLGFRVPPGNHPDEHMAQAGKCGMPRAIAACSRECQEAIDAPGSGWRKPVAREVLLSILTDTITAGRKAEAGSMVMFMQRSKNLLESMETAESKAARDRAMHDPLLDPEKLKTAQQQLADLLTMADGRRTALPEGEDSDVQLFGNYL